MYVPIVYGFLPEINVFIFDTIGLILQINQFKHIVLLLLKEITQNYSQVFIKDHNHSEFFRYEKQTIVASKINNI